MGLDEIKKALAAIEKGPEFVAALESHITEVTNAEKSRGIEEKSKANREAEGLRKRVKKFEEVLGVDSSADDFETKLNETKTKIAAPASTGPLDIKTHPEVLSLNERLKAFEEKDRTRAEKEKTDRLKMEDKIRRGTAMEHLTKLRVHKDALGDVADLLSRKIKVREDDTCYVEGDDGKPLTVEAFTADFVKSRPYVIENSQGPGGGGGPGGGDGRPKNEPNDINARRDALRQRQATYGPKI